MASKLDYVISEKERLYLRELAKKQQEYSALPVMERRKKEWIRHNAGRTGVPMVIVDIPGSVRWEFMGQAKCESALGKEIEQQLLYNINSFDMIGDDKVVPDFFYVPVSFRVKDALAAKKIHAADSKGVKIGYTWEPPIKDLKQDIDKLKPWTFESDLEGTYAKKAVMEDILGDILPVVLKNKSNEWNTPIGKALDLLGMENLYMSMYDYPEEMHQLMSYIRDNMLAKMLWQEEQGLLTLNTGNDYAGAGSVGFTDELPSGDTEFPGTVKLKDIWYNLNAQEAVGLSPEMYEEFVAPYYYDVAKNFGLVYYGCCEPVEKIWDSCISKIPKLRKVSISAWCDENFMGEALRGTNIVYCRKPSPNYITNIGPLDEGAYTDYIRQTLTAAKGCTLEICLRDLMTFGGEPGKVGRAVSIIRREISRM